MKCKKLIESSLFVILIFSYSCNKNYLDTKPSNAIRPEQAYESVAAINSSIRATFLSTFDYSPVAGGGAMHDAFGQKAIDLANDLMGNDMIVHSQGYGWFNSDYNYTGWQRPTPVSQRSDITWTYYYRVIKEANLLINNISESGSPEQLAIKGEALGLRAWAYFGLANNFQQTYINNQNSKGVPIYTSQEPSGIISSRGTLKDVYDLIIKDLTAAERFLTGAPARESKARIDLSVIRGFRARVALVMGEWSIAADYAKKARTANGYKLMDAQQYTSRSSFSSINNPEWMWGSLITEEQATVYASFFAHIDATQFGYAQLGGQKKITKDLYDQIPDNDIRKNLFTAPNQTSANLPAYTQIKFRVPVLGSWAADYLYMRIAEMYLIEAEALARDTKDGEAIKVLEELVKQRYPSYSTQGRTGNDLIEEILLQRRIELWGEGFSLFDIKRNQKGLNRPTGSGNHGAPNFNPRVLTLPDASSFFLMRIPQRELDNNPSMTQSDQNP
jgi:hypothetical protein